MMKRSTRTAIVPAVALLIAGTLAPAPGPVRAMIPEDIYTMNTVSLGDLSADGRFLLYGVARWDEEAGSRLTTLFRRDFRTGEDLLIFTPADHSSGVAWRPDGQAVAFVRRHDDGPQIWLMDADGSNRRRICAEPGPVGALHWAPDGSALAWIAAAAVGPYEGVPERVTVARDIAYRHLDQGYRRGTLRQLFVLEIGEDTPRRLFAAELDLRSLSWAPDADRIVFEAKAREDLGYNLNTDLWLVDRAGGEPVRLTRNPGRDGSPVWFKPDRLSWLRATDPLWESAPLAVAVMDPARGDGEPLELHGTGFDNRLWKHTVADGRFLVLGAEKGCIDLVQVEGKTHRFLTGGGHDFWSLAVAGSRVILAGAGQTLPGALFELDLDDAAAGPAEPRILIDPNEQWRRRVGLIEPEPFAVEVEGRRIEGWVFKPEGLGPAQKAPVVLSIHGGPEWMYGGYFLPEFHILPNFGYGVVIANPTGSIGYGFEFQKAIRGDWVGRPARELMACLDHVIDAGWADPDRLAVMGGSFGGHLGAALTTQTDRFRAAALDRMFPENIAFWGTTDEKWFPEWEFLGKPWEPEAREVYRRNSPFEKIHLVDTPTLVSHGMRDYRCLIAGGEMWFSGLQARGVPSRFLRFENEGHGIRNPANQVFYQHELLDWFDRHVLGLEESHEDIPDDEIEVLPGDTADDR